MTQPRRVSRPCSGGSTGLHLPGMHPNAAIALAAYRAELPRNPSTDESEPTMLIPFAPKAPLDPHVPYLAQLAWHDAMHAIYIAQALACRPPLPTGKGLA